MSREFEQRKEIDSQKEMHKKTTTDYAIDWDWKGWFFFLIGKFELAKKCYDKSLELLGRDKSLDIQPAPSEPKYLYPLAFAMGGKFVTLFNLGKLDEYTKDLEKLEEAHPENTYIKYSGSWKYYFLGEFDKALEWLEKWMELEERETKDRGITLGNYRFTITGWYTTIKGYLLYVLERFDEAITYVDKSLEKDPNNSYVYLLKGRILNSLGRYEEAIECYNRFIDKKMKPDAWVNEEMSQAAMTLNEVWSDYALTLKGNTLSSLARYEEAISCYNKALEMSIERTSLPAVVLYNKSCILFPEDAEAWHRRISALSNLDIEVILGYHDKWLESAPNNVYVWTWKGITLSNLGRYEEAISCYNKALEINPNYALAQTNKGNTLCSVARYEEAISCYNKALEINPNYALAQTNIAIVNRRH